jgi:hypothetical protein
MVLRILADHHYVVVLHLVLNYMRIPPTYHYVESNGRVAYMETHPYLVAFLDQRPTFDSCVVR